MPAASTQAQGLGSLIYHAKKLYGADVDVENLTDAQRAEIEAMAAKEFRVMQRKGLHVRLLNKATRLRLQADQIEAMVAAEREELALSL
jgi:hypothetical protein